MKTKDIKKGISLIVLIITIIVVIILAAVVILTLSKNNPIESAKEARFKENVRTFQDELSMTVSKQYANAGGHRDEKISTSDFDEIKEYIPSFSEKYRNKFIIQDDEIRYTKILDEKEKEYAQSLNVKEKIKLLPDEYQQVEYIESTGTQYIDTNLNASQHKYITVEIEGKYTALKSNQKIFCAGYWNSSQDNSWILMGQTSELGFIGQVGIGGTEKTVTDADTQKHFFGLDSSSNKAVVDACIVNLGDVESKNIDYNYVLFSGCNGSNITSSKSFFRMYSCKIIENGEIILYLIPCLDSNNKACMYDLISNNLFYNGNNEEDFIVGPEVY